MSSIDADVALRGSFAPESNASPRFRDYLTPDRSRNSGPVAEERGGLHAGEGRDAGEGRALPLNLGVGWIEVLRPRLRFHNEPESVHGGSAPRGPDDDLLTPHDLAPIRGIMLGVALGASLWALIGGLIGILFLL